MEPLTGGLQEVTRLIQLAVAPIFLLMAVSTTLTVLIARLGRIVDRGRWLETRPSDPLPHEAELRLLEKRAFLIYRGLSLGVSAAIMVCLLMTAAFLGETLGLRAAKLVGFFFIAALFAYTGALVCLLREVFLALRNFHLNPEAGKS